MNNHDQKRYVIAISGASGTGKSTLVKALVQILGDAVPLYFDDYNPHTVATSHYPIDLVKWVADGADPNAWETPQLALDLRSLRRGEPIKLPGKGEVLLPKRVLVLEEPFGRERTVMKDVIDFVIAIDAPLEIALARRLLRIAERPDFLDHLEEQSRAMLSYVRDYLHIGRELYIAINEQVRKHCDLVLDGMKPIDALADTTTEWLRNRIET